MQGVTLQDVLKKTLAVIARSPVDDETISNLFIDLYAKGLLHFARNDSPFDSFDLSFSFTYGFLKNQKYILTPSKDGYSNVYLKRFLFLKTCFSYLQGN
jgi:hypothetical protein